MINFTLTLRLIYIFSSRSLVFYTNYKKCWGVHGEVCQKGCKHNWNYHLCYKSRFGPYRPAKTRKSDFSLRRSDGGEDFQMYCREGAELPNGQESDRIVVDRNKGLQRPVFDCMSRTGFEIYENSGNYLYCKRNTKIIEARLVKKFTGFELARHCIIDCAKSSDCV